MTHKSQKKQLQSFAMACCFSLIVNHAYAQIEVELEATPLFRPNISSELRADNSTGNTPSSSAITHPSSLGCQVAQLEQDAKTPIMMVPIYDDLIIPVGGRLAASWLPPKPSYSDNSIEGVDIDGDCVRDDIERYIANLYPKKSNYKLRENLFRYAIWMNRFLNLPPLIPGTHAKVAITNMQIASKCVTNILGNNVGNVVLNNLFAEFHNTWPRSDKYMFNMVNYISGWSTRDSPIITCN